MRYLTQRTFVVILHRGYLFIFYFFANQHVNHAKSKKVIRDMSWNLPTNNKRPSGPVPPTWFYLLISSEGRLYNSQTVLF